MAKMGKVDFRELKELQKNMEKMQDPEEFMKDCAKELAARLLAKVIKRTPTGDYDKPVDFTTKEGVHVQKGGKKGGTLKRGWTAGKQQSANAYLDTLTVRKEGKKYIIELINPVEYASYVEYGHRTRDHKGWVPGKFMMTISEQEVQRIAPQVLEARAKKYLKEMFR